MVMLELITTAFNDDHDSFHGREDNDDNDDFDVGLLFGHHQLSPIVWGPFMQKLSQMITQRSMCTPHCVLTVYYTHKLCDTTIKSV